MIKINYPKLARLRDYALKGGSQEFEEVCNFLGIDADDERSEDVVNAYVAELSVKYPEDFPPEEDEGDDEDEGIDSPAEEVGESTLIAEVLMLQDGVLNPLEIVTQKGDRLVVQVPRQTDKVTLILRGKTVTVDLLEFASISDEDLHPSGVTMGAIRAAAAAARA